VPRTTPSGGRFRGRGGGGGLDRASKEDQGPREEGADFEIERAQYKEQIAKLTKKSKQKDTDLEAFKQELMCRPFQTTLSTPPPPTIPAPTATEAAYLKTIAELQARLRQTTTPTNQTIDTNSNNNQTKVTAPPTPNQYATEPTDMPTSSTITANCVAAYLGATIIRAERRDLTRA
jgi:hypothetical protein